MTHQYSDSMSKIHSPEVSHANDRLTLDVNLSSANSIISHIEKRAEPVDFAIYRSKGEQSLSRIRNVKAEEAKILPLHHSDSPIDLSRNPTVANSQISTT